MSWKILNKTLFVLPLGRRFEFRPRLLPSIGFIIFFPILMQLANWQFDRAGLKRVIFEQYQQRPNMPALGIHEVMSNPTDQAFYKIKLAGFYDNHHQFLLDNRVHQGQAGYEVLTPLHVHVYNKVVLVDRGWIPNRDRSQLPQLRDVRGMQHVVGLIKPFPKKIYELKHANAHSQTWPRTVQSLVQKRLSEQLGKPIEPFIVLLDPNSSRGFVREWKPNLSKPSKHLGYAFQWLALALTLVIIYAIFNIKRKRNDQDQKD